jgi:hypothetical protein
MGQECLVQLIQAHQCILVGLDQLRSAGDHPGHAACPCPGPARPEAGTAAVGAASAVRESRAHPGRAVPGGSAGDQQAPEDLTGNDEPPGAARGVLWQESTKNDWRFASERRLGHPRPHRSMPTVGARARCPPDTAFSQRGAFALGRARELVQPGG